LRSKPCRFSFLVALLSRKKVEAETGKKVWRWCFWCWRRKFSTVLALKSSMLGNVAAKAKVQLPWNRMLE